MPSRPSQSLTVLTIAGSDSSGGAGIQADLKTASALGCYGLSVITALTAQNTQGVRNVQEVPPEFIQDQMAAVFEDISISAVKVGMLQNLETIGAVVDGLKTYRPEHIVVDPVMFAKSGDHLLEAQAVEVLKKKLLPLATLLTPNLLEAGELLSRDISTKRSMQEAAEDILQMGPEAVLIKGGNLGTADSSDYFCFKESKTRLSGFWLEQTRFSTQNLHGAGCSLSSAIASFLARGHSSAESVRFAKDYVSGAIEAATTLRLGKGKGPIHHFYQLWRNL